MAVKKAGKKKKGGSELPLGDDPGVGQKRIPEVDKAAAEYVRIRDRRMEMTPLEVKAKEKLISLLHKHEAAIGKDGKGSLRYVYENTLVELVPTGEQLKVKAYVDPGEPD